MTAKFAEITLMTPNTAITIGGAQTVRTQVEYILKTEEAWKVVAGAIIRQETGTYTPSSDVQTLQDQIDDLTQRVEALENQ